MNDMRASPVDAGVETCDVLVIGGGPGGAATATLLAEAGLRVILAEKERHPRFHIGESLLPQSMPILERLGVLEAVRAIGVEKRAARFVSEDGETEVRFAFDRALLGGPAAAVQVERAGFDRLLFERARAAGADCLEATRAEPVEMTDTSALVRLEPEDGPVRTVRAGLLVDASGRSALMARRQDERARDPMNSSAAVFGHFRGVPRDPGVEGGDIRIHLTRPGWVWQIPLRDGITSLGLVLPADRMVARGGALEPFFRERTAQHPALARLLAEAEPVGPMRATGNFSYRARTAGGGCHLKVGDAYGFIDPIFSTGVHLALLGAVDAAATILAIRARPDRRAALMAGYEREIVRRMSVVSWFIYRIHDPALREMLLHPRDILGVERAVISLLAGDFRPDWRIRSRTWLFRAFRRMIELGGKARGAYGE